MNSKFSMLALTLVGTFLISSCRNDNDDELIGNWVRVSDLDGKPRSNASAFVVNGKGYISGGYSGENRYKDLWSYDPDINSWTQKADLPGVARSSAVGFATNSYGYVGTGYDGLNKLKDFYRYDPSSNSWSAIATEFPGTERYGALAFGIEDNGYVGTGYDGNEVKDFYKYIESSSTWLKMEGFPGTKRKDGAAFVINKIAYVGFGVNNGTLNADFWAYDPTSDTWNRKVDTSNDDDTQNRKATAAFSAGGLGYVATGSKGGVGNTTWEYNPSTNDWTQRTSFEGAPREGASAFSIGNYGYVLTGNSGSSYFDDIWVFHPNQGENKYD